MRPPLLVMPMLVALAACSREAPPPKASDESQAPIVVTRASFQAGGGTVNLPKAVGPWARPDDPKVVTAETIFDYMDGAGELYVGYRFDHLDVFEYTAADASLGTILVELYWMKDPHDAFGLLSTDWGGETLAFDQGAGAHHPSCIPPHRALYGAGLLRMWNRGLYVRVLAARDTVQAREAIVTIGGEIDSDRVADAPAPHPPLLLGLRGDPGDGTIIRPDRTCFFRSHLVLNSAYYLASEDILGLGPDVEGVTTEFKPPSAGVRPTRLILVRYPSPARARAALTTFTQAYLPESATRPRPAASGSAHVENGWVAWMLKGQDLAIALDASSQAAATTLTATTMKAAPEPGSACR